MFCNVTRGGVSGVSNHSAAGTVRMPVGVTFQKGSGQGDTLDKLTHSAR